MFTIRALKCMTLMLNHWATSGSEIRAMTSFGESDDTY